MLTNQNQVGEYKLDVNKPIKIKLGASSGVMITKQD